MTRHTDSPLSEFGDGREDNGGVRMSDWDRFALQEYSRLACAEEEREEVEEQAGRRIYIGIPTVFLMQ